MKRICFPAPGEVKVVEEPFPALAPNEIAIAVSYLGICGTDVELYSGHSAYVRTGVTSYPVKFGHEWSGTVVDVGEDVDSDWIGARVTGLPFVSCGQCQVCRGGKYNLCPTRVEIGVRGSRPGAAAEIFVVPVENVARIPDSVDTKSAVLAEPTVTVLNGWRRANAVPGDKVAVIGTGTLGLLAVAIASASGCEVTAIGIEEAGLELAAELGATRAVRPGDDVVNAQVVIEASGSSGVGETLADVCAPGARVSLLGIPSEPLRVYTSALVAKGVTVNGVLGGVDLLENALKLIERRVIDPDAFIHEIVPAREVKRALELMTVSRRRPKVLLDLREF